jgi:hypothetical protein
MSLLDDLRGLDVSGIVNARGSIRVAVEAPALQGLLTGGAASSALGALGSSIDSVRDSFAHPEALLRPVMDAVQGLGVHFDASRLPLGEFATAVQEGMEFISRLAASVTGNPSDFGRIFGTALGDAVRIAGDRSSDMMNLLGGSAAGFGDLTNLAAGDLRDTHAITEFAADLLLPFPKAQLRSIKDGVAFVLDGTAQLRFPSGRAAGLVAALDAVTAAAAAGNSVQLEAALANLRSVREHTIGALQDDLRFAVEQLNRLRIPQVLAPLAGFSQTIRLGEGGVLDFFDQLRRGLHEFREPIENPDFEQIRTFLNGLAPMIELRAREGIEVPIDNAVSRAKDFVRRIMRQIPVRQLRNELTKFLHEAADAINHANLQGPADAVHNALGSVASQLDAGVITNQVQNALQHVNSEIENALNPMIAALTAVETAVNDIAGQAEAVLNRAAQALRDFQSALDGVAEGIDQLGIEQIEEQMVQSLQNLRHQAESILSNVPLPEPLRPQVEQLISLLEGVDFGQMLEPVRQVVAQLRIPPDVSETVTQGLAEAKRVIENLIPQQLIASIQAEVDHVLQAIAHFNPASLLPDVTQYFETAAKALEELDPRSVAEQIRGPFQTVLDVIDQAHPNRLLAPVIQVYDSLLSNIPAPDGQAAVKGVVQAFDSTGRVAGRALTEPARRLTGVQQSEVRDPDQTPPTTDVPPPGTEIRAGDAIRLLGFVPSRLRDFLRALEAGPAGDVIRQLDSVCAGLARQIRQVQAALYDTGRRLDAGFEEALLAAGPAQLRAQFTVHANFSGEANVQASLDLIGSVGPGALRAELAGAAAALRLAVDSVASGAGGHVGASLERLAVALESSPLGRIGTDLERLLQALDPEPIAAEVDALVNALLALTPRLLTDLLPDLERFVDRLRALINHYSPGAQAEKFLAVIDVVRDELNFLDPRRLASELAELHGVIRAAVAAYDPRTLAEELAQVTRALAQQIRALNPTELLGNLDFLQTTVSRLQQANPATRLASVGAALHDVGETLGQINLDELIESINGLGPRLETAFEHLLDAVKNEIIALLESLRVAMAHASASVSVSASAGTG